MTESPPGGVPWVTLTLLAVLVNTPLAHGTLTAADPGCVVVVVTLLADAALVVVVLLRRYVAPSED